ncbi:MAG: biopolymer transporter ExbD [Pseudomonadota bacterium]|nr:biopolymer transporter ExbD [Pseudomonadota bacterium]
MTTLSIATPRRSRRPSLTPMIDVVFLLLVFFMLASRFGAEGAIPISGATGADGTYEGPPRLVDVLPEGVLLNGSDIFEDTLAVQLERLMQSPEDTIVLRAREGADVQRVVDVMQVLAAAGYPGLVLVD